jgi:hypothetical protein
MTEAARTNEPGFTLRRTPHAASLGPGLLLKHHYSRKTPFPQISHLPKGGIASR